MSSEQRPSLLIITNLYPSPWDPGRAAFNRQQFDLLRDSYDLHILVPVAFPDWLKHRREITNSEDLRFAPYFYIPRCCRRFYSYFMYVSLMLHSSRWIRRHRPDKVFASWAYPDAVCAGWIARRLGVPFTFKVHGSDINVHAEFPARARQIRAAAKRAEHLIAVSEALAKKTELIGVPADKVRVIYNGVNHEQFGSAGPAPYDKEYILFVGNLKREKGVIELLEGFASVAAEYPLVDLVYVGEGAMREALIQRAKKTGVLDRVQLVGAVDHGEVPAWIGNCRFLAIPSYSEGVPNVILEAFASGKPVLATDVGGIPEVMNNTNVGILVAAGKSASIAAAIPKMLKTDWSEAMIRSHGSAFSWAKNKTQLLDLLGR